MQWTRAEAIGLARPECHVCEGMGLMPRKTLNLRLFRGEISVLGPRNIPPAPCYCVLRRIFRICLNRFLHETQKEKYISKPRLTQRTGVDASQTWERPDQDYIADFFLVSRRTLTAGEWAIFSAHFLLGGTCTICCRQLGLDRGAFFHVIYRIEHKLGSVFRDLEPYSLYPLSKYFSTRGKHKAKAFPARNEPEIEPRAPLSMSARGA